MAEADEVPAVCSCMSESGRGSSHGTIALPGALSQGTQVWTPGGGAMEHLPAFVAGVLTMLRSSVFASVAFLMVAACGAQTTNQQALLCQSTNP